MTVRIARRGNRILRKLVNGVWRICTTCCGGWTGTIGGTCCDPELLPDPFHLTIVGNGSPLDSWVAGTYPMSYAGDGVVFAGFKTWRGTPKVLCHSAFYGEDVAFTPQFSLSDSGGCNPIVNFIVPGNVGQHCFGAGASAGTFDCPTATWVGTVTFAHPFFGTDSPNCCGLPAGSTWTYTYDAAVTPT